MGRRRRKVVHIPKKKLPTIFLCPICGKQAITIEKSPEGNHAKVHCTGCELKEEFDTRPVFSDIDIYCQFTDLFYSRSSV